MATTPGTIRTVDDLRQQVPAVLRRLNADQGLLLAATANPLLALEELGYRVPAELREELDRRIRFTAAEREQLVALTARMHEIAGVSFDPDDSVELERLLFERLALPEPPPSTRVPVTGVSEALMAGPSGHWLAVRYRASPTVEPDVLRPLQGTHPIIAPLLEYRAIRARRAPFAPREVYDRIRRGMINVPAFKLRGRVQGRER